MHDSKHFLPGQFVHSDQANREYVSSNIKVIHSKRMLLILNLNKIKLAVQITNIQKIEQVKKKRYTIIFNSFNYFILIIWTGNFIIGIRYVSIVEMKKDKQPNTNCFKTYIQCICKQNHNFLLVSLNRPCSLYIIYTCTDKVCYRYGVSYNRFYLYFRIASGKKSDK